MVTHRWSWVIAAVVGVAVGVVGCDGTVGDPDDGGGGGGGEALEGLAGVRFAGQPPEGVTVVDVAEAAELLEEDEERFAFVGDMGTPLLSAYATPEHRYGLDADDAETAVTVGFDEPYGFWWGDFDAEETVADLEGTGFAERDGWWAVEGGSQPMLRVSEEEIAWGTGEFDPAVLAEGERLSEVTRYQVLSECLDEPFRADFVDGGADEPVTWAVGQRAESAVETSEVMCVVTETEAQAGRIADSLRETVSGNREWYGGAEVRLLEGAGAPGVRVTVPHERDNQRPGWVLRDDTGLIMALNA